MWGGLQRSTLGGEQLKTVFKNWSNIIGLQKLRQLMVSDPRPWNCFWHLHQSGQCLTDKNCATLMLWVESIFLLENSFERKVSALRFGHDMFGFMLRSHRSGEKTTMQFFRLCEAAGNLSLAAKWFHYLASKDEIVPLVRGIELLRIAAASPSNHCATEMVRAVCLHFNLAQVELSSSDAQDILAALSPLLPRLFNCTEISKAVRNLEALVQSPLPPQKHIPRNELTFSQVWPKLKYSIFSDEVLLQLEEAVKEKSEQGVQSVLKIVRIFQFQVASDAAFLHGSVQTNRLPKNSENFWASARDAWYFRMNLANTCGATNFGEVKLTSELYHFLISSLIHVNYALAKKTYDKIVEEGVQPLDSTTTILCCHSSNAAERASLISKYLFEARRREQWIADHQESPSEAVLAFWNYDYGRFIAAANSFSKRLFFVLVAQAIGCSNLLKDMWEYGSLDAKEVVPSPGDLIVLDCDLCRAVAEVLRSAFGKQKVEGALHFIYDECPKMDIALIGEIPFFQNFAFHRDLCDDPKALQLWLRNMNKKQMLLLDSSFLESLTSVGDLLKQFDRSETLVVVPFLTLDQLRKSAEASPPMDPEVVKEHVVCKEQALSMLKQLAMCCERSDDASVDLSVLSFSETLLSHRSEQIFREMECDNIDNSELVAIATMLRAVTKDTQFQEVFLCTNDPQLLLQVEKLQERYGFSIVSTQSNANDGIQLDDGVFDTVSISSFSPRLSKATQRPAFLLSDSEVVLDVNENVVNFFEEFGAENANPEKQVLQRSSEPQAKKKLRARSFLARDFLNYRHLSHRRAVRLAKIASNEIGAKVPWNFAYRRYSANVSDPRNRHLLDTFRSSLRDRSFRRKEND